MVEAQSLVRGRDGARIARLGAVIIGCFILNLLVACAPARQSALIPSEAPIPHFETEQDRFVTFDGAALGLTVWEATSGEPEIVVVGVHGMNDYANAFHMAAPWWAERGVTTYAYDQRSFGRSPDRGIWPDEELLREDLRTAVRIAREQHPDAILALVGISMGGAVAMTTYGSDNPPEGVDRLVLTGPGLRGWGALPLAYRVSLWSSAHMRPAWVVTPPANIVRIEPSDNIEMLRRSWNDPLMLRDNRIDHVLGAVTVMENAHKSAHRLPVNTFLTYGAKDIVIPPRGMKRTAKRLPAHVRTAYYADGYHMLLRDLQAETVWADILSFMQEPDADIPSGAPELPWR
ncbi:MAG: alpha/beta fold hydrolase [Hyphomonadaceae bacterium]